VLPLTGPLAGAELAATLADRGLARPLPIPPNDANAPDIARRVRSARAAHLGLWSACGFERAFPGK
jgi:endonuclease YncB( thermonuclease family)